MKTVTDHPAVYKTYEIIIGGVAYPGQCREVRVLTTAPERDDRYVAVCQYFNDSNPDATFKVEVDANGKALD